MGANILTLLIVITGYTFIYNLTMYIFARVYGVRIEKFIIWYDTKFALFKIKIGDTIFGMGWLPLGGYLKISGMSNDSMDDGFTILPHHFLNLSSIKQAITCTLGPLSNLIIGIGVYAYYNNISMISFFISTVVIIVLILSIFLTITEVAKRIRIKNNTQRKSRYYIISILVVVLLLIAIAFSVNYVVPLFETVEGLIEAERYRFITKPFSQENTIALISGMGVALFFINMIPISSLIGSIVAKSFYIAFTGDTSNEMSGKYQSISLIFLLMYITLFVYLIYKFLI